MSPKPLAANREHLTVYCGLDHGIKGGHFAVHSFLSGVQNSEAQGRPDGNVSIDLDSLEIGALGVSSAM